ncbi:MAG: RluA family pseudouridine synthase [Holosporales bacterium]|nr:RluA family pseudouridine synthase [Holosporales bacterium]
MIFYRGLKLLKMALSYRDFVCNEHFDVRLDRWLRRQFFQELRQGEIERAVRGGFIRVNGKRAKSSMRVSSGCKISIEIHLSQQWEAQKPAKTQTVSQQHRDAFETLLLRNFCDFCVINKPAGLDVQGGRGINASVDHFLRAVSDEYRLVHRLDRETSGALIVAKTLEMAIYLTQLFREHKVQKTYRAIVLGRLTPPSGKICAPLLKRDSGGGGSDTCCGWSVVVDEIRGKPAETVYRTIRCVNAGELVWSDVELFPRTGRKHQLRVHMAHIGTPIAGDSKYGVGGGIANQQIFGESGRSRKVMLLHSHSIKFKNKDGKLFSIEVPLPDYWPC